MAGPHPMTRTAAKRRITLAERDRFRQELIDIARRIFLDEGYGAVTIRRITSEAGVTPMAFYWYFDCKDALLTVIWDDLFLESAGLCQAAAQQSDTPLLAYYTAFIDFWLTRRDHFRFVFLGDSRTVDFARLRRQLLTQPGVQRHLAQMRDWAQPLLAHRPDASAARAQLLNLALYRALGFLHAAVAIFDYDDQRTRLDRDLVLDEMRHTLARWQADHLGTNAPHSVTHVP